MSQRSSSEHPSIVNMLKGHKHRWNLHNSPSTFCLITVGEIELENVSASHSWLFANLFTVDVKHFAHNREN